jgi:enhancer of polycomb-like protein
MRIDIENKIENHRKWNLNHIDLTRDALEPLQSQVEPKYRPVKIQYLMTPPNSASASAEGLEEPTPMDLDQPEQAALVRFQGLAEDDEEYCPVPREYRRRIGRLNRLWIDRRDIKKPAPEPSFGGSDRWKYDQDSDDDELVCEVDPYDIRALKFRASIPLSDRYVAPPPRRGEGPNGVVTNGIAPASRPALPPPSVAPATAQQPSAS